MIDKKSQNIKTTDIYSEKKRSEIMSKVLSKNTKPEIQVRSWLHRHGYRFRLHQRNLPGQPDIVMTKYKTIIFVHGCFWHQHLGCKKATIPKKNHNFWKQKLIRNVERDKEVIIELEKKGWNVIVIWECEVKANLDFIMKSVDISLKSII